ncbi:MAG: hypothetical protein NXI24_07770 [bacterium]|nr:hypothetical protein [bacterium]
MHAPPEYDKPSTPGIHSGFEGVVHILQVVSPDDDFATAANAAFALVREAQAKHPGQSRVFYVDIHGHTGPSSGYEPDFFEFQQEFLQGFLGPFLTAIATPLQSLYNPNPQRDDLPDLIDIQ